jgi:hypothetical protein
VFRMSRSLVIVSSGAHGGLSGGYLVVWGARLTGSSVPASSRLPSRAGCLHGNKNSIVCEMCEQ